VRTLLYFGTQVLRSRARNDNLLETAYMFAFSVLMLNDDAHHPEQKVKKTLADFNYDNQRIDNGQDLSMEFMGRVYNSIYDRKIETNTTKVLSPLKHGWMEKQSSGISKKWQVYFGR
jgi:Sec7-like guanine-nucleotide exchange factor